MPRFSGYRQRVRDRLAELGYWSDWKLIEARDFGVPQLRPRFILVAINTDEFGWFSWPEPTPFTGTVGTALYELMAENGWPGAPAWAAGAHGIAPTIVGGSKKHGGGDLGPTRARAAWAALGVDGRGIADAAPSAEMPANYVPKLTTEMVARIQGWQPGSEYAWEFTGRKTTRYRQIGNAFPPPVARAIGSAIAAALSHASERRELTDTDGDVMHDPVYVVLRDAAVPLTAGEIVERSRGLVRPALLERRIALLARDFEVIESVDRGVRTYELGDFKGFVGQADHERHMAYATARNTIS
jgi:DNA (cytosine-5)-methyltransferase 1